MSSCLHLSFGTNLFGQNYLMVISIKINVVVGKPENPIKEETLKVAVHIFTKKKYKKNWGQM